MDDLYRYADFETRLRGTAHALGVVLAAFAAGVVVLPVVVAPFVDPFVPLFDGDDLTSEGYLIFSAVQFVGFIAVAVGYVRWKEIALFDISMPSLRDVAWIVGGFIILYVVAHGLALLISALGLQTAENSVIETGRQDPRIFLYMIPISFLLIGPGEELVFRGVVQGLLRKAYGVLPAVLVASVLFGVAHTVALQGGGKATYVAVAIGLGLVLGSVYERSENILVPIVIHGAWNAMLFAVQWYLATNPDVAESLALLP